MLISQVQFASQCELGSVSCQFDSIRAELNSGFLFGNFWLEIQNIANRQVRNLFLEVSWLYLSRFPGAL
jgi:hypothetical protein